MSAHNLPPAAKLTTEQKIIAVAKARAKHDGYFTLMNGLKHDIATFPPKYLIEVGPFPPYATSLDAMAEAESAWIGNDHSRSVEYRLALTEVVHRLGQPHLPVERATAADRFEAFGKTLNLW